MSQNGPPGTIFNLAGELVQEHTIAFSLALLPPQHVLWVDSKIVSVRQLGDEETRALHTTMVGVNGGPEEAKAVLCKMIDDFWKQRPR